MKVILDREELEGMAISIVSPDNHYHLRDTLEEATDSELTAIIRTNGDPVKEDENLQVNLDCKARSTCKAHKDMKEARKESQGQKNRQQEEIRLLID